MWGFGGLGLDRPGETRDPVEIKIAKGGSEALTLGQNGSPAEAGLKAFQAQFLEQAAIIAYGKAPLGVVIPQKLRLPSLFARSSMKADRVPW